MTERLAQPSAGKPLRVAQLITTLARGGAQATVVGSVDIDAPDLDLIVLAGVEVTEEGTFWADPRLDRVRLVPVPNLVRHLAPIEDIKTLVWLIRWLRANRPDVFHTHSSKAGVLGRLAAALTRTRCVHTVHGWGPLYSTSPIARTVAIALERILARLVAAIVVVGYRDRASGLERGIGKPEDYRLIRSGVETSQAVHVGDDPLGLGPGSGSGQCFVVGMVARLSPPKDHETLIEAFAQAELPCSVLVLIGDGPKRERLEALVEMMELQDSVRFLGQREDADRLVGTFDVAVLSSRWEGMPRTVVEAAAAGVPVISTDVGSVAELIENGVSGRLVEVGDTAAMVEALRGNYFDRDEHLAMADVAIGRVAEFSVERMREELADLWRNVSVDEPSSVERRR